MEITLAELRAAFEKVIRHLEDTDRSIFRAEVDFYWDIPMDQRYDVYSEPVELTVGQISEEITDVKRITAENREAIGDDLRCIGVLLRLMGEKWTY